VPEKRAVEAHLDLHAPLSILSSTTTTNTLLQSSTLLLHPFLPLSLTPRAFFHAILDCTFYSFAPSPTAASSTQEGGSEVAPLLHHSDFSLIRRTIDLQAILGEH
jgi:hypothetical protein